MEQLQILGTLFTLILGTLLHFTYAWSGKNAIVGIFSATNESTWEHLKLLAMPILLFGIAEYFAYGKQMQNFIPIKTCAILLGMAVIVVAFYTYTGIIGNHFLWADIGTFVIGVIASYWFSAHFFHTDYLSSTFSIAFGWIGFVGILFCFALFSFFPPYIGLFLDPVSHRYGK